MEATPLPLGAVRTADGRVEIPASTRADGSTRRAIRVRAGYVPQDEVRAYRTPAQRRREDEQQRGERVERAGGRASLSSARRSTRGDDAGGLTLASLSIRDSPSSPRQRPRKLEDSKETTAVEENAPAVRESRVGRPNDVGADRSAELKKEITRINRLLKDIAALEKTPPESLTDAQQAKVARKAALQRGKSAVIAQLTGATVEQSTTTTASGKTRAVISM